MRPLLDDLDVYLGRPEIDAAAAVCEAAGRETSSAWATGQVADEDDFTSILLERLRAGLSGLHVGGTVWTARKMTSRFEGSEEARTGADLLGVLEVVRPDIVLRKGFLAQSKLHKPGDMKRLREQCRDMLDLTPDAFVFLYGKKRVSVVPALLFADGHLAMSHVEPWSLERFFAAHFSSYIGDSKLSVTSKLEFAALLEAPPPREILVVEARSDGPR